MTLPNAESGMKPSSLLLLALFSLIICNAYAADKLAVSDAWVRATAPGQQVGAAYMTLKSNADITLTKVQSDITGSVEIHEMAMKNGVMKMRMKDSLPLPAGKPFKLEPGGFHLMLFDLKKPLKPGEQVAFTLEFEDRNGKIETQKISAPIKAGSD